MLFVMMYFFFFGYEIVKGYASNTPSHLFSGIVPTIIYSFYGLVRIIPAIILFAGCFIGGLIGAKTAIKKGNVWVKTLFIIVVIMFVIKILFF